MAWRDAGDSLGAHAAGLRFQEVFADSQKWLRQPRGMFHRVPREEAEITETLIVFIRDREAASSRHCGNEDLRSLSIRGKQA